MAIDPSIPLQIQPLRLGEIFAQAQQNRQDLDYRQFQMDRVRRQDALEDQDRERARQKEELAEYGEAIKWADTPEKWDRAIGYLEGKGKPVAQYRGRFDLREQLALELGQVSALAEPEPDEYTLGEGQVRYRGDQVVARGPDKPQEYLVIPEGGKAVPKGAMGGSAPTSLSGIWQSLIQQESGGRPGVTGPETPYGRAQGLTQMLPATAQAMAQKTGLPWQPQMMSDASPEGAAYQEQLGRAYFQEGLQKYGGDVRKALMYYHGGPNEALWGPKTRAYADQVMARAGQGGQQPGDPAGTLYGNPKPAKPRPARMTPQEVAAEGLDPGTVYYRGTDGVPEAVSGQSRTTAQAKAVPDTTAKRMEGDVSARDSFNRLIGGFRNDYAGNTVTGGLENTLQGILGTGTPGQRDWWADFQALDNQIRNDLFGATLTPSEQTSYANTSVNPKMTPGEIRKNLIRRRNIVNTAVERRAKFLKANGYNPEAVDALRGGDPLNRANSTKGPAKISNDADYEKLPSGAVFIAPDGTRRRKP